MKLLTVFLLSIPACAQLVSVGVTGGLTLTNLAPANNESKRFLVGPSLEFRLPANFAIEIDALYQRTGNSAVFLYNGPDNALQTNAIRYRNNVWTFPVLAKYYFGGTQKKLRPFVSSGWAIRHVSSEVTSRTSASPTTYRNNYGRPVDVGAVAAAGVRLQYRRLAVLPEFRYTRWGSGDNLQRRNDVAFLLGLRF